MQINNFPYFLSTLLHAPEAFATLDGDPKNPRIRGRVTFHHTPAGVLISTEVSGLPVYSDPCNSSFLGFHIHQGSACTGTTTDPFLNTQGHLNPLNCMHPHHAGDLPPLLNNNGYAFSVILTDRISIEGIIGSTLVIHEMPDDFHSQPAGNSGAKIACGIIIQSKE